MRVTNAKTGLILTVIAAAVATSDRIPTAAQGGDPCAPPNGNPIVCENQQGGSPASEWDIVGAGDPSIQGFATDISVNRGQTIDFKISTDAPAYHLDIYRMGFYGGMGARKVASVSPSASLPQTQPACLSDSATGLIDCGNWALSASWSVPSTAVSGIYFAKAIRSDSGGASHIFFVVRDDTGSSDLLFQTSDTTWQAYNRYGGNSLYVGSPVGRAYKVSYNRPFTTREYAPEDWVFNAEYPMVRWLEANGYNVSYFTGVDSDRRGAEILEHRVFLSVGHDEYWSAAQRTHVENARAAGVHLAFFSGNEVFWKTRWENSLDDSATPHRTLVSYKETHADAKIDPLPNVWTGTWEDPRFSPPADGGRPANALTGTLFRVNTGTTAIQVPSAEGKMRFWRNTPVAGLAANGVATLAADTLGYEWDEDVDNGHRPAGLIRLSSTTVDNVEYLQDYGSTYAPARANHALTLYRHSSGALVFGAGTVQWAWGLDANHDRGSGPASQTMRQATMNLLADMQVQPRTPQSGMVTSAASTDTMAPASVITSPTSGSTVAAFSTIAIAGNASDAGGGLVGGVEVSVDGGVTWNRARGRSSWTYSWQTGAPRTVTILARAVDDSGNLEQPSAAVTVTVAAEPSTVNCPCSIWPVSQSPVNTGEPDSKAVEVGVRFRASTNGYISGIRFYKSPLNTGVHIGNLWSEGGINLGSATFVNESTSGWQEVTLPAPVAITAGAIYVASYHTSKGRYAADAAYFDSGGFTNGPLEALSNEAAGGNGVFRYGNSRFPTETFGSTNYWVDVVFVTAVGPDTTPPFVTSFSPAAGEKRVSPAGAITVKFSEPMNAASLSSTAFELLDPADVPLAATLSYSVETRTATLQPSAPLAFSTRYTARVRGGSAGPKDVSGNALADDTVWSFTTASRPPTEGPGGPILVVTSTANRFTQYYAEILRSEGLNAFAVLDIASVTPAVLGSYDVVILGEMPLTAARVTMFSDWVTAGGNLIAMRPDNKLAPLLGLVDSGSNTVVEGYLRVTTTVAPGTGIVGETMQFHGTADRYTLAPSGGTAVVATLYTTATAATTNPAVTVRSVGTAGGHAAAFTYDLARSVVYTRQGNPAWAGQDRDGSPPIRPDDLFFGGIQPDYVDRNKIAVPQADEQQRLLANLIGHVNSDRQPLPRFWYFPRGLKAVIVMTGDDHASANGTAGQFDWFNSRSAAGCSVANWECVRATSYVYPDTPISDAQAQAYVAQGFEIAAHPTTGCQDYTAESLAERFDDELGAFSGGFSGLPAPETNRTHCVVWSDWASQADVSLAKGIRLDTNYYHFPAAWVNNVAGLFTGSGMPMRFADIDGRTIDVYQATTQMTDESAQSYPSTVTTLLNRALGAEGYYGAFVANMHTDFASHASARAIVTAAQARNVPVISAKQLLDWLDGRNEATYNNLAWNGSSLTFVVSADSRANGLQALVPAAFGNRAVNTIVRDGSPVTFTLQRIKGVNYAVFDAAAGTYTVDYTVDATVPAISGVTVTPDAITADITWTTDEYSTSRVEYGTNPNTLDSTAVSEDLGTAHTVRLTGLLAGTAYYFRVISADPVGNTASSPTPPAAPARFTTTTTASLSCPCSIWNASEAPVQASASDPSAVELGVKFRPAVNGFVTAVRFYKGPSNTGAHTGRLWTSTGALLGTVTFTNESASGWQQANFAQPIAVSANTTYVVSYHTSVGHYAADHFYFQNAEVVNGPLRALADGVDGSNGVFKSGTSGFPNQSFRSTNYWVDVVFVTSPPPAPPPPLGATDTTVADFSGGSAGAGTYVARSEDGEISLAPSLGEEFFGSTIPGGWSLSPWAAGGVATFSDGQAAVDGALFGSDTLLLPNQRLEFAATFAAERSQHAGFALSFNESRWAIFSTGASGQSLLARTHDGVTPRDTLIPGNWLGTPHRYRIDWTSTSVTFFIDGVQVASHPAAITAHMRPGISDLTVGGAAIGVDWMRLGPYAASGTFTSRVLDAEEVVNWTTATSSAQVPAGTTLRLSARLGNTPTPDGTWTTFNEFSVGTAPITGSSRYVQYQAVFTGDGAETPVLQAITFDANATPPAILAGDVSMPEGNSGVTYAVFPLSLSVARNFPVTVTYATVDGTATAGADYIETSGTAVFDPGVTSTVVLVPVLGDLDEEETESFLLNLSAPVNGTVADGQAVGTIVTDDLPAISIADASLSEGAAGTTNLVFTVTMSKATTNTVTVNYASSPGTARDPNDYTGVTGTLTLDPGVTQATINVAIAPDTVDEIDETFLVTLSAPTRATLARPQGTGTILDDDLPPTLSITDTIVTEGNTGTLVAAFAVTLSAASEKTITVRYATANGTAVAPGDYTAASATLTLAPGATAGTVNVTVRGDVLDEADETFVVNLTLPTNVTIARSQAAGTITDNDPLPTLAIANAARAEGNSGTASLSIPVTLSAASGRIVTVDYATADGTAQAGADYSSVSGTLVFPAGATTQLVNVPILGDTTGEPTETFTVTLANPTNASVSTPQATGTIQNDDGVSIGDVTVTEGNAGTVAAVFELTLTSASAQTITVDYTTADLTATAGTDFGAASGTVTFAPGTTTASITVAVNGDVTVEPNETFTVNLSNPVNTVLVRTQATGTIATDDVVAGLVAAYNFDEAGGDTVLDRSASGLNGTITGATRTPSGHTGGALTFNGTSSWVTVPDNALLDVTRVTISAWVRPTTLSGWRTVLLKETVNDLAYGLYAHDNAPRPAAYVNTGGSNAIATGTAALALNAWTYLAATFDGTAVRFYVNGTLVRTVSRTGSIINGTGPLRIGGNAPWGEFFAGQIDDVRVYNRALTQTEIQSDRDLPVP